MRTEEEIFRDMIYEKAKDSPLLASVLKEYQYGRRSWGNTMMRAVIALTEQNTKVLNDMIDCIQLSPKSSFLMPGKETPDEDKEINQEKIFKFLWPDKCWHKWGSVIQRHPSFVHTCLMCSHVIAKGNSFLDAHEDNPDLTTPDGMVMILDRLVEVGYRWNLSGASDFMDRDVVVCQLYGKGISSDLWGDADTAPLAVLSAMESLIRKEEEGV